MVGYYIRAARDASTILTIAVTFPFSSAMLSSSMVLSVPAMFLSVPAILNPPMLVFCREVLL